MQKTCIILSNLSALVDFSWTEIAWRHDGDSEVWVSVADAAQSNTYRTPTTDKHSRMESLYTQTDHTHTHTDTHSIQSCHSFARLAAFFQTSLSNVAALNQKASWRNARSLALPPSLLFLPLISFPLRSCLRGVLRARQNRWGSGIKMMNAAHFGNEESSPQQMRRNGLQLCWKYNPRKRK